jgi:hypothetical protein
MDFYADALARGAIVETPEEIERKKRSLLPRARAVSTGGTVTNTVQPGEENIRKALDMYAQEDDYSQAQNYARTRADEGSASMLNALAAQYAGPRFEGVQGQYLKRSMAAREPMKMGSAMITPDGQVLKDPSASREREAQRLMQLGQFQMQLDDRKQSRQEAAWLRQALASQGTWKDIADPATGKIVLFNTKTGERMPFSGDSQPTQASGPSAPGFNIPQMAMPQLTDVQDKARFFAQNMAESLPTMIGVIQQGYMPNRTDQVAAGPPASGVVGSVANAFTPRSFATDQGRTFYTEGRKVLAAILRKESGAAITDDEWSNYGPIYLPWPGDKPDEINRKMIVLGNMANNMALGSGPAYRFWAPPPAFAAPAAEDGVIDLPSLGR